MNKALLSVLLLALFNLTGIAQDDLRKSFETFRQRSTDNYKSFADSSRNDFAVNLSDQWEMFNTFRDESHLKMKPSVPRHAEDHPMPEDDIQLDISGVPVTEAEDRFADTNGIAMFINSGIEHFDEKVAAFEFYGNNLSIEIPASYEKFEISSISEKAVSHAWELFESYGNSRLLSRMVKYKSQLNLNDWGVFELVEAFSNEVFKSDSRLATVCAVNIMNHLGLDVRMARVGNSLVPIFSAKQTIYSRSYIEMEGIRYYLPDTIGKRINNIYTYRCQPSARLMPLDMKMLSAPVFSLNSKDRLWHSEVLQKDIRFSQNPDVIRFYGHYPHLDLDVYARCSPSDLFAKQVLKELGQKFRTSNPADFVNMLLKVMHNDFRYKTDTEQFGHEKVFFVEENFFYEFNDCEDRSVLFSWFIRNVTGLKVALLEYGDHVNCAVAVPGMEKGMYLNIRGTKYYVCDPTYIGAAAGMSPKPADVKPDRIWML